MSDDKAKKRERPSAPRSIKSMAAPALAVAILLIWQFGVQAMGISQFILPTPWSIVHRSFVEYRLLLSSSFVTVLEVVAGFVLAAIVGIVTALAIFYSRLFERAVYPFLVALQTIPKVALAPLLVLYLGYGFAPKCFLAFLLAYFPIVIATVVGLQALEKEMVNLARSMGASEWQIFFKIRMPAALPNVFGGFKVGNQPRRNRRGHRRIRRGGAGTRVFATSSKFSIRHHAEFCRCRGHCADWRSLICAC